MKVVNVGIVHGNARSSAVMITKRIYSYAFIENTTKKILWVWSPVVYYVYATVGADCARRAVCVMNSAGFG